MVNFALFFNNISEKSWSKDNKAFIRDNLGSWFDNVALNICWSRSASGVKIKAVDKDTFCLRVPEVDAPENHKLLGSIRAAELMVPRLEAV